MKALDCESIETTYISLEQILGVPRAIMEGVFAELDEDAFAGRFPPDEVVYRAVRHWLPADPQWDQVCWFHLTRALPTEHFEQGIQPLSRRIDALWDLLKSVSGRKLPAAEWRRFQQSLDSHDSHFARLYRMKVKDPLHWGPYAVLVRDLAFRPKEFQAHDYLDVPEIVEDVGQCFEERYGYDLLADFRRATRPCIVKFVDAQPRPDCLTTALFYLYCTYRREAGGLGCNTCFDGEGWGVSLEQILRVEFFDSRR